MDKFSFKQRDIVYLNLNPTKGKEQKGLRPVVIVSGDDFNVSDLFIVCPLTTSIKNYFGNIILKPDKVNGLEKESEILIGQIRTVDANRCIKKIGSITEKELKKLFRGLDMICGRF